MQIPECQLQWSNNLAVSFVEIDMQMKWICSSVFLRDFFEKQSRRQFWTIQLWEWQQGGGT